MVLVIVLFGGQQRLKSAKQVTIIGVRVAPRDELGRSHRRERAHTFKHCQCQKQLHLPISVALLKLGCLGKSLVGLAWIMCPCLTTECLVLTQLCSTTIPQS